MRTSTITRYVLGTFLLAATLATGQEGINVDLKPGGPKSWEAPFDEAVRTPTPPLVAPDTEGAPPEVMKFFKRLFPRVKIERVVNLRGQNTGYRFYHHLRGWLYRTSIMIAPKSPDCPEGIRFDKVHKYITLAELSPAALVTVMKYSPKVMPELVALKYRPNGGPVYFIAYPNGLAITMELDGRIIFEKVQPETL